MDILNSTTISLCQTCGYSVTLIQNRENRGDRDAELELRCAYCNSSNVSVMQYTPIVLSDIQLHTTNLYVNNELMASTANQVGTSSVKPVGYQDFTIDEILHVLTTFESGIPLEEVQKLHASYIENMNSHSVDPRCCVESGYITSSMKNTTTAVPEGPQNPSESTNCHNYGWDKVRGLGTNGDVAEASLPCSICLVDILGSSECIVKLFCNHYYHQTCLRGWLKEHNYTCPMCRKPLIAE